MKRFLLATICLFCSLATLSAQEPSETWQAKFKPVPPWLRMHLPMLRSDLGLLVDQVDPKDSAHRIGLRVGDILIEVNGKQVQGEAELDILDDATSALVVRRGVLSRLPLARPGMWLRNGNYGPETLRHGNQAYRGSPMNSSSFSSSVLSSSSVSGGSDAVALSRAGDQVSLHMNSSDPAVGQLEFRGTMQEMQKELDSDTWSDEVKAAVRRALKQAR